jgi:hypothetical protein
MGTDQMFGDQESQTDPPFPLSGQDQPDRTVRRSSPAQPSEYRSVSEAEITTSAPLDWARTQMQPPEGV